MADQSRRNVFECRPAGVSDPTVDRIVAIYREHGIEGLKQFDWKTPTSELVAHQTSLEEMFRVDPPHTTAEVSRRIEEATGINSSSCLRILQI